MGHGGRFNVSKELYLLRHAKSRWNDASAGDRQRGLNKRGRRDAPRMGRALAGLMEPQAVRVSPARRAQLTLGGLQDGWPELQACEHLTEEALYTFSADDLVAFICGQDDISDSLFLIGHNPGLTDLVNLVCGVTVLANLPTAGFAHLSLAISSWSQLDHGCGRLHTKLLPRELDA
jgi:phosphohistidine phosphatase